MNLSVCMDYAHAANKPCDISQENTEERARSTIMQEMSKSPKQAYSCDHTGAFQISIFKGNYVSHLTR